MNVACNSFAQDMASTYSSTPVTKLISMATDRQSTRQNFLKEDAKEMLPYVSVCPYLDDSTVAETIYVNRCLQTLSPHKVLLVTSDWHTARALSIFRKKLPQYQWSIASAHDIRLFGPHWWRHREWAKTTLHEWVKTVWWNLIDRWR